jgi:hypothetical protein
MVGTHRNVTLKTTNIDMESLDIYTSSDLHICKARYAALRYFFRTALPLVHMAAYVRLLVRLEEFVS